MSFCLCVHASGEEVSSVPGPSSSFSTKTGAAHPDGPPSQPHAVHRSQVTNSNHLRLCVTDAFAPICFSAFALMPRLPSAVTLWRTFSAVCWSGDVFSFAVKCQVKSCSFTLHLQMEKYESPYSSGSPNTSHSERIRMLYKMSCGLSALTHHRRID